MLLVMMVSPLTQGSRQVGPDRIEQHRPDARLRQCALDLPDDVRAHCQIGRVDLEYKAGVDHSAIFVRHLAGDRIQRGLVRGVIRIQHGGRDDARRRRSHEALRKRRVDPGGQPLRRAVSVAIAAVSW